MRSVEWWVVLEDVKKFNLIQNVRWDMKEGGAIKKRLLSCYMVADTPNKTLTFPNVLKRFV